MRCGRYLGAISSLSASSGSGGECHFCSPGSDGLTSNEIQTSTTEYGKYEFLSHAYSLAGGACITTTPLQRLLVLGRRSVRPQK